MTISDQQEKFLEKKKVFYSRKLFYKKSWKHVDEIRTERILIWIRILQNIRIGGVAAIKNVTSNYFLRDNLVFPVFLLKK